jgi:hypothetical protein
VAYDLYQNCGLCIGGYITVDGEAMPCQRCGGTGKLVIGDIPNLEVAISTLTTEADKILKVCKKILDIVEKV